MIKIKQTLLAVLAMLMIAALSSCGYFAHKTYYSNTADYAKIWLLSGLRNGDYGISPIFPEKLDGMQVDDFFCRYDEQLPLGEGFQIHLNVKYGSESDFAAEIERISSVGKRCDDNFSDTQYEAYSLCMGEVYSYEYALADRENSVIHYLYLQGVPKDQIEIDNSLIPDNYSEYGSVENK